MFQNSYVSVPVFISETQTVFCGAPRFRGTQSEKHEPMISANTWSWMVNITPGEQTRYPEASWKFCRREKCLIPLGIQTLDPPECKPSCYTDYAISAPTELLDKTEIQDLSFRNKFLRFRISDISDTCPLPQHQTFETLIWLRDKTSEIGSHIVEKPVCSNSLLYKQNQCIRQQYAFPQQQIHWKDSHPSLT